MNIFFLSTDPAEAAQYLCDKHVSKMQLETAQLLSSAVRMLAAEFADGLYRATHRNHPSAVWVRQSSANVSWLYSHAIGMADEWLRRGHKQHASLAVSQYAAEVLLDLASIDWPSNALTDVPLCVPDDCRPDLPKHVPISRAVAPYRDYYVRHKVASGIAKWPPEHEPWWLRDHLSSLQEHRSHA